MKLRYIVTVVRYKYFFNTFQTIPSTSVLLDVPNPK